MPAAMRIDPLLRHTVGFVRRAPGWAVAVGLAAATLAAAAATPPMVSDAAADRSFTAEVDAAAGQAPGRALDARAITSGIDDVAAVTAVSELLDELPVYGSPLVAAWPLRPYTDLTGVLPIIRNADGTEATAVVYALDGATESFGAGTGESDGIWVPDSIADELHLVAGDQVEVALVRPADTDESALPSVTVPVAGVYPTEDRLPVSEGIDWPGVPGGVPDDPVIVGAPARLLITDTATALTLMDAMGDTSVVTWDLPWQESVDLQQGRIAAASVARTDRGLTDLDAPVPAAVHEAGGSMVTLRSGVGSFVDRSERAAAELQPLVASIAVTAQVMSALVLVVATWLLSRNRRREHQLSMSMGFHPARLSMTTVLELLIPVLVGVGATYVVVRWWPQWVAGDGTIDPRTLRESGVTVLRMVPVVAVLIAAAAFAAVWPLEPSSAGRARRVANAIHVDTLLVVAAVVTGVQLMTLQGRALESGSSLLFPLFAQLAGAVVVVRLGTALTRLTTRRRSRASRRRTTRAPRSLAVWLAARRALSWLGELSMLVVVVAAGVGLFVYSTSIGSNGERGVRDKAAALGGAVATVPITATTTLASGPNGLPTDLPQGWTVLWATTNLHVGPDLVTDLLIVDPATFPDAVDWRDSFSDPPLPDMLAEIDDGNAQLVDVILAGNYNDDFPERGDMDLLGARVQYRVVERIAAASWIRERSSMMIVSARLFAGALPPEPETDPPLTAGQILDRRFHTYVWADVPAAQVTSVLGPIVLPNDTIDLSTAARTPAFVAFGMSLPYLRIVGIGLLAVGLVSIVVLGARRRADLAMEIAMTDRMGIAPRTTTVAVAGGAVLLGLIGSAIGIVNAQWLVSFMLDRLDPSPALAPSFDGGLSMSAVVVAVASVVAVSVLGAWVEVRGARRARVVEVLRGAE